MQPLFSRKQLRKSLLSSRRRWPFAFLSAIILTAVRFLRKCFEENCATCDGFCRKPMLQLGRLLTLRGMAEQANGRWEQAAVVYFDGLRLGRHMTHQQTVVDPICQGFVPHH